MFSILHTLFYFLLALAILVTFHEFGHFWVARRLGIKVLRFSVGFGAPLWRYQKSPDSTEFTVCALPLGGYVRMVDEREAPVEAADLPHAFNRQPLWARAAVVFAGPLFNFILAILLFWMVFMLGEPGFKPLLGPVDAGTLAAKAGFQQGDELLTVDGEKTPTWGSAVGAILEKAVDEEPIIVVVRTPSNPEVVRVLSVPAEVAAQPEQLQNALGFKPWEPTIDPIIGRIEPGSPAETAGLQAGDRVQAADDQPLKTWQQLVDLVRAKPAQKISLLIDRTGQQVGLDITPASVANGDTKVGRIGAGPEVPEDLLKSMQVTYQLAPGPALLAATIKTWDYSALTLKMMGRMLVGRAAIENLSGPISIAQFAGQSASIGLNPFLRFLAIVSVSLAVLNLLPVPVLDGGHLLFYLAEAIQGKPLSTQVQAAFQHVGMFLLLCLMGLALFMDFGRLFN